MAGACDHAAVSTSARKDFERRQRRWADAAGVDYDSRGYVREPAANCWRPLAGAVLAQFERGSELTPGSKTQARMCSLRSSAALVANVFDYWRDRDNAALVTALGLHGGAAEVSFEEPLPTGLEGEPPLADVLLRWPSGRIAAIESKFGEWLVRRPHNKAVFKAKYFPAGSAVWAAAGLVRCQALAAAIQEGRERFKFLHAAQLLKHALGLARSGAREHCLVYLYYDWPGREAEAHRAELDRLAALLRPEIDLRVLTYQALFRSLCAEPSAAAVDYRRYLAQRYFPAR
jgi:hypothetical protein